MQKKSKIIPHMLAYVGFFLYFCTVFMKQRRDNTVTYVKAIGIILMVVGHELTSDMVLRKAIFTFHMPLFFLMSGYCFKEKYLDDAKQFVVRKIKGIYVPFVAFSLVFLALHNVFCHWNFYDPEWLYGWKDFAWHTSRIVTRMSHNEGLLGTFWFLKELFLGNLIFYTTLKLVKRGIGYWKLENGVEILYGNMIKKDYATGKIIEITGQEEYSLRLFYASTLNHDCCYIRRDLFDTYGLYDENLKIVSDWKWFLQAIGLGQVKPVYVDIDVTIFDASGISENNLELRNKERKQVLEAVLPPAVLSDYDKHAFEMEQMKRLRKHHLYWFVYFIERVLFKLEKWHILK